MKIRVTFKDPDGPADCIAEAVRASVVAQGLTDPEEVEAVYETRAARVKDQLARWMEYGECLTVEFDTDAGTAVVVEK